MKVKTPNLKFEKNLGVKKATLKTDKLLHGTVKKTIKTKSAASSGQIVKNRRKTKWNFIQSF